MMIGRPWIVALLASMIAPAATLNPQQATSVGVRGLARLTLIEPTVWMQKAGETDKVLAVPATRLDEGDIVSTGDSARAEIAIDPGVFFRLDERSVARIAELTTLRVRIELLEGLAQVVRIPGATLETRIETPAVVFQPYPASVCRLLADSPEGGWQFIVHSGKADVVAPEGRVTVRRNKLVRVRGIHDPEFMILKAPRPDEWDQWNWDRNVKLMTDAGNWCRAPVKDQF